jgi:hypothetical protein
VYVWSGTEQFVNATVDRPDGLEFHQFDANGLAVFIEAGLDLGRSVTIERDTLPPWRLTATWDGMAWVG